MRPGPGFEKHDAHVRFPLLKDFSLPLDTTPILVGGFQKTWKVKPGELPTAVGLIEVASRGALENAGVPLSALDTILTVEFTIEAPYFAEMNLPKPANPATSLAKALGVGAVRTIQIEGPGGNSPQMAVNQMAEEIVAGRSSVAVLSGAEFLNAYWSLLQGGANMSAWISDDGAPTDKWGRYLKGETEAERNNGMERPTNVYPLIENAIRARRGSSVAHHMASMGRLMAPFTEVAAANPHSWFPTARSAEEIATVTSKNRMVGFPYPKYMNAIMRVDQAASVVMTSVGKARELGIPEAKWVYLHGCGDAADIWNVSERPDISRSPAIKGCWDRASRMAGVSADDLDFIDLYSCFPSAVEIACEEIGLAEDDPRGLTVTGGLPYFGGPGNNYAMHSIVSMMDKVRSQPGSIGLCTANGWYVTKHSMGIYSANPFEGEWRREDPSLLQAEIDAQEKVTVAVIPEGPATVETCTVIYGRDGPMMGIVIGRLEDDRRFVANTPTDEATLLALRGDEAIGARGLVKPTGEGLKNMFTFS